MVTTLKGARMIQTEFQKEPFENLGPNTQNILRENAYKIYNAFKEPVRISYTDEKHKSVDLEFTAYPGFIQIHKVVVPLGCKQPADFFINICRQEFGRICGHIIDNGPPKSKQNLIYATLFEPREEPNKTDDEDASVAGNGKKDQLNGGSEKRTKKNRSRQCRRRNTGRSH